MSRIEPTHRSPGVSIVVVTHNSAKWIEACLSSLLRQQVDGGFEVVMIDHASSDETVSMVRRRFPGVRLIEARNRGFGAGCNAAVRHAKGAVVAFHQPDAVAEPGWLQHLIAPLASARIISTSQVLLLDQPDRMNTIGHGLHFAGLGFTRGYRQAAIRTSEPFEVPGFSGAAFAMRRAEYEALGGFDEDFFLYQEDTEFSWRARRAGFRILAAPGSRTRHRYAFSIDANKLFHVERGRALLLRKHLRPADRVVYAPSLSAMSLALRIVALRYGRAGWAAISRARKSARMVPRRTAEREPAAWLPLSRFAARKLPAQAVTQSRLRRILTGLLNAIFRLNTAFWRRTWKDPLVPAGGR